MQLGKMHEAKVLGEAGNGNGGVSGTADFPYAKVYMVDSSGQPINQGGNQQTANNNNGGGNGGNGNNGWGFDFGGFNFGGQQQGGQQQGGQTTNGGGNSAGASSGSGNFFDADGGYFGPDCDQGTNYKGAYYTGDYTSPFKTILGKSDSDIQGKLDQLWNHYFKGDNNSKVFYDNGSDGYILDINNNDVRSEGMSYGMMISVQTGHKTEFDKLWNWAKKFMWHKGGGWDGYFAWKRGSNGYGGDDNCAPDGEMYFMMSLLFAAHRWNNSGYNDDAQYILNRMWNNSQHKLFNPSYNIITFQPQGNENNFSDPSYDLPAFVDLFFSLLTVGTTVVTMMMLNTFLTECGTTVNTSFSTHPTTLLLSNHKVTKTTSLIHLTIYQLSLISSLVGLLLTKTDGELLLRLLVITYTSLLTHPLVYSLITTTLMVLHTVSVTTVMLLSTCTMLCVVL